MPAKQSAEEGSISETLILTDFDKTLTDCDAGNPFYMLLQLHSTCPLADQLALRHQRIRLVFHHEML